MLARWSQTRELDTCLSWTDRVRQNDAVLDFAFSRNPGVGVEWADTTIFFIEGTTRTGTYGMGWRPASAQVRPPARRLRLRIKRSVHASRADRVSLRVTRADFDKSLVPTPRNKLTLRAPLCYPKSTLSGRILTSRLAGRPSGKGPSSS